ncbi:Uncharacterized protein BM_BM17116 [Brugia malayi]|uniref:Xaa-Pro dipeptidyl-peptidase-like domain-containing protein n=1 Tax=Brugia malayi TaxID=6279 RepID=A0A4E9FTQ4_BRUMA|nr:Uncharacterized protein BM_BM17116 [Brugia malayi]VIO99945.1 Uncharacterized protein BM_BM17116 [Brugia malayi]
MIHSIYTSFVDNNFSALKINFRGVGKSTGTFDKGIGELTDAAIAIDWLQEHNPSNVPIWIVGFSFGAWVAMQLIMRRPEIVGFIAFFLPATKYDFSFLSPCPVPGLIIQSSNDTISEESDVTELANSFTSKLTSKSAGNFFTISCKVCAETFTSPSVDTSAASEANIEISRSVAINFMLPCCALIFIHAKISIALRLSTTPLTLDSVLKRLESIAKLEEQRSFLEEENIRKLNLASELAASLAASVRLGMGDFIFYSLLVDKASATRSTMCVADSMAGWLAGILTLAVLSSYDEPTTALSVPIDYHRCTATFRHLSVRRTIP